jgi:GTP-binding protein YchF
MANLSLGIVGLPNVGKSTLFNALVKNGQALASNYPFATIDPNVGVVEVPDSRLGALAEIAKPERIIPATVEFLDIAGIIKGASQGEGLGNAFLGHIRSTAAILLVARFFESEDIIHVNGKVDPKSDLETVLLELILADLDTATRGRDRYARSAKGGDKVAAACHAYAERVYAALENQQLASTVSAQSEEEQIAERELQLLTAKPMLVVANVGENQLQITPEQLFNDYGLQKLVPSAEWIIPISAQLEAELAGLSDEDRSEFLKEYGLSESGLNRLVRSAYHLLGLQTYFTAGPEEVRAWTIRQGWKAPEAAGVIHTDFTKGFIRAEVIAYDDFVRLKGEQGAKEGGRLRLEGKEYVVQDGDVMHFRFNV